MNIKVKRITPPELWRECAEMTTGKPCKMSWFDMLKTEHSPIREQRYLITFTDVPQLVTGHIIRHDKFANPFVRSKRIERGGEDFTKVCNEFAENLNNVKEYLYLNDNNEEALETAIDTMTEMANEIRGWSKRFDRHALSSFAFDVNAEEIMTISRKRLCAAASPETREIWMHVLALIEEIDPDLVKLCVKPCIYSGICRERKSCGFNHTELFQKQRQQYQKIFVK